MTRSQKVVLIALALILVLFVLVVWHGATRPACASTAARKQPECRAGGGIRGIAALTSPFAPGVKLPKPSYVVAPNASVEVTIPAASDKMRRLKLKLAEGSAAQLSLANLRPDQDPDPDGMAKQRDISRNSLPFYDDDHALQRTMTLVVTDLGGQLTMRCLGSTRCVFEGG